jgi:O-antigen ligase
VRLRYVPVLFVIVTATACAAALAIGALTGSSTRASLAWGLYVGGGVLVLLALPRDEPREYDQAEVEPFGLKETAATILTLLGALLLVALGVVVQTR